ncbi:hypothetical protein H4R19_005457, partial [Coemansia spiralis]
MGDGTPASRPPPGNPAAPASPLRIFTRVVAGEGTPGGPSTGPRDGLAASPGSAFGNPPEDAAGRAAKVAPRMGRQSAHYHPLPTHWCGYGSSPGSAGSPVTPDSGGAAHQVPLAGIARSPASYMAEAPHPPPAPARDHGPSRAKLGVGHGPAGSPYGQGGGSASDAFGPAAGLDWAGDRPGSRTSYRSGSQQAESSPMDQQEYGGHFLPPPVPPGTLAARPGASRGTIGASRHHPSASMTSLHYSYSAGSPVAREPGTTPLTPVPLAPSTSMPMTSSTASSPALGAAGESPDGTHGEDIVRRYFGRPQAQPPQPWAPPPLPQPWAAPTGTSPLSKSSSGSSAADEAASSIVYRRAVSSGDLPTLDELRGALRSPDDGGDISTTSFLSHDLVESPLEALVRRLTIELFQLYVSEDRQKGRGGGKPGSGGPPAGGPARAVLADGYEDIAESLSRVLDPLSTDDGYVQQFRLGPSLDSGSTTPAVTMDGYFVPHAAGSRNVTPTSAVAAVAAAAASAGPQLIPRPRPRHRQLERTWMEEALIKARRVSTIDETAGEAILQGLNMESTARSPMYSAVSQRTTCVPGLEAYRAGSPPLPPGGDMGPLIPRSTRRGHAQPQGVSGEARAAPP